MRLRLAPTLAVLCVCFGLPAALVLAQTLNHYDPISYLRARPNWAALIVLGYAGALWFLSLGTTILASLVRHGPVVFLRNQKICYLHELVWSVPVASISRIAVEEFHCLVWNTSAICFTLTNARQKWLSTQLIEGTPESVADCVRLLVARSDGETRK
jgi:hypothetical protein